MKATDKPQISKKWWTSEKPADVKGAELEKALAAAEKALADQEKKSDAASFDSAIGALADVNSAVEKTIKKEMDKTKHKDQIKVLEKYGDLVKSETKRLEDAKAKLKKGGDDAAEGEDEEESDEKIFQPDYLQKMIKLLKSTGKELNFGFGLDTKNPEASKLVFTRKGKPERLFKALKKTGEFSNRLITYGTAMPDPADGKVLVFKLAESAGEPPQVLKLGRRYLRSDKGLKFRKLKLIMPGGQTIEDTEPDTEDEGGADAAGGAQAAPAGGAGAGGDLQQRLKSAATAAELWNRTNQSAADQIAQLRRELNAFDDPDVVSVRDRLATVLDRFPKLDFDSLAKASDAAAFDRSFAATKAGITQWQQMLKADPALKALDENPFVDLDIVSTFGDALGKIAGELKV
jgi:hypothetical protein